MKHGKINLRLLVIFAVSFLVFLILSILSYSSKRNTRTDISPLTLTETQLISPTNNDHHLSFIFHPSYPRLGTIRIEFGQLKKDQNIKFELHDLTTKSLISVSNHSSSKFGKDFYYPFGFPIINNHPAHNYLVTISDPQSSIFLIDKKIRIQSQLKLFDLLNPTIFIQFISNKINELSTLYTISDFLLPIIVSLSLPIIYYLSFSIPKDKIGGSRQINLRKNSISLNFVHSATIDRFLNIIIPIVIFATTLSVTYIFARISADPHHDGIMYKSALDVSRGLILFRDTFTQYGAVPVFIQALSIKILGEHLLSIKITTVIAYALISIIMWFINIKFLPKLLAIGAFLLWLIMSPYTETTFLAWPSVYCILWQLLAITILYAYIKRPRQLYLFMLGIICAVCMWTKQSVGGVLLITSFINLLLISYFNREKLTTISQKLIVTFLGFGIVTASFFLWLYLNHAFYDWWLQSIIFSKAWIGTGHTYDLIMAALMVSSRSTISFWAFIPLTSLLIIPKIINKKIKSKNDLLLLTLVITGIGSWHQYYPVSDIRHTYWASSIMFGTSIYCVYIIYKNVILKNRYRLSIYATIFTFIFLFRLDINSKINSLLRTPNQNFVELDQPKMFKGMKLTGSEANFITQLSQDIDRIHNKYPNINLITIGPDSLYLGMVPVSRNAHQMYLDWGGFNRLLYPDFDKKMNQYILLNKPLIIYTKNPYDKLKKIPSDYCKRDYQDYQSNYLLVPCSMIKLL